MREVLPRVAFTLSAVFIITIASLVGRGQDPAIARVRLEQKGIPFTAAAFVESARKGDVETLKLFLAAGTNPNSRETNDKDGSTVLMVTAMAGQKVAAETLIASGANVNARSNAGKTALFWAA